MKTKKKRRITFRFKLILLACFLIYTCVLIFSQQSSIDQMNTKNDQLVKQYASVQDDLSRLKHENEYMTTEGYIENQAREKLGLAYKDEIILGK